MYEMRSFSEFYELAILSSHSNAVIVKATLELTLRLHVTNHYLFQINCYVFQALYVVFLDIIFGFRYNVI